MNPEDSYFKEWRNMTIFEAVRIKRFATRLSNFDPKASELFLKSHAPLLELAEHLEMKVLEEDRAATHVCGLSGFGALGDVCPACQAQAKG